MLLNEKKEKRKGVETSTLHQRLLHYLPPDYEPNDFSQWEVWMLLSLRDYLELVASGSRHLAVGIWQQASGLAVSHIW